MSASEGFLSEDWIYAHSTEHADGGDDQRRRSRGLEASSDGSKRRVRRILGCDELQDAADNPHWTKTRYQPPKKII